LIASSRSGQENKENKSKDLHYTEFFRSIKATEGQAREEKEDPAPSSTAKRPDAAKADSENEWTREKFIALEQENERLKAEVLDLKRLLSEKEAIIRRFTLLDDQLSTEDESGSSGSRATLRNRAYYLNEYGRQMLRSSFDSENTLFDVFPSRQVLSPVPSPPTFLEGNVDYLLNLTEAESRTMTASTRLPQIDESTMVRAFVNTVAHQNSHDDASLSATRSLLWTDRFGLLGRGRNRLNGDDGTKTDAPSIEQEGEEEEETEMKGRSHNGQTETKISREMDYEEFISLFMKSQDLVDRTRRFLLSVHGPAGDYLTPPARRSLVDYDFQGLANVQERCREFFNDMQERMKVSPKWGMNNPEQQNDERVLCARDMLEQYVMYRIGEGSFTTVENKEEDEKLLRRMKTLSFLRCEVSHLIPATRSASAIKVVRIGVGNSSGHYR
jgi:hypothetical protein